MREKIRRQFFGRQLDLRERLFRIFLIAGSVVCTVATIEVFALGDKGIMPVPLLVLAICFLVALVATFKYHQVAFSTVIIGLAVNGFYLPMAFLANGGVDSGASVWFVIGFFYIFLMFSGKSLAFFLTFTIAIDSICYLGAYFNPDILVYLDGKHLVYFDSFFSVLMVGISTGLVLVFQRKVYEQERAVNEDQKEALEKAANSKNAFFAKMSHEIRTPINTIIGLNQMNLREELPEEAAENCISISNAGDMLLYLVNDILDMAQLETGKMKIIPAEYETRQFFINLVDMLQLRIKNKGLDFFIDIDNKIPSVLYGDEKRLTQVMINILTNAAKYTSEGSVILTARGEWEDKENFKLVISVADTGMGIRKEDLEDLFDYFTRLDERKNTKVEGSGLGLSISKQLLDLMDGQISVDSIYTKGSTFTISLTQKVVNGEPVGDLNFKSKKRVQLQNVYRQSFEAPDARVLLIDDDSMNHVVMQKLLRATKLQLDCASDWKEALEMTKKKYYHVLLLDHMMPGKNGLETLYEIRHQENGLCREVPALCLTGNLVSGAEEMYRDAGFQGYLTKPVQGELLEAEILQFLPEEVIEYQRNDLSVSQYTGEIKTLGRRKRKVCITTDCICDLSEEYIEKFGIKKLFLYIETETGRFKDTTEMDSDNLFQYLTNSDSKAVAMTPSVEEVESFFADALTEAEDVIYISYAANVGKGYERAVAAAKCFDHVHVVDSGHISGGLGTMVLYAAKMAQEEHSVDEIVREMEQIRDRISSSFILPTANVLYQRSFASKLTVKICDFFNVHPVICTRQSKIWIYGVLTGTLDKAKKRFVRRQLRWGKRIHADYIIINHAACSVKELESIKNEVEKCVPFTRVIIQKASVSTACSAGLGSIGLSFYKK